MECDTRLSDAADVNLLRRLEVEIQIRIFLWIV